MTIERENLQTDDPAAAEDDEHQLIKADNSSVGQRRNSSTSSSNHDQDQNQTDNGSEEDLSENDNKTRRIFRNYSVKMLVLYSREVLCVLALILTTLATLQNRQAKTNKPPTSRPIFASNSFIQEWANGDLNSVQNQVAASELSLIYFYAPWCAESLHAKSAFERVASAYHKEMYFAAVNCWQPGGECRAFYSKVNRWPVLMAYLPRGLAVQYNGDWNVISLSKFIDGLLRPIQRIRSAKDLLRLRLANDMVVLGQFDTVNSRNYQVYFQSAVKWLEIDPVQNVRFAIHSGSGGKEEFNMTSVPGIRLYSLNGSVAFNATEWTTDTIHTWVKRRSARENVWLALPNAKAKTLAPYIKSGPSLVMFTARNLLNEDNLNYLTLKQAVYSYKNCNNDSSIRHLTNSIPALIKENIEKIRKLRTFCSSYMPRPGATHIQPPKRRIRMPYMTSFQNTSATAKDSSQMTTDDNEGPFCHVTSVPQCTIQTQSQEIEVDVPPPPAMPLNPLPIIDQRSPGAILKTLIVKHCQKLSASNVNEIASSDINTVASSSTSIEGLHCKHNRSLSFLALDSHIHPDYIRKFTGAKLQLSKANAGSGSSPSGVFIIDSQKESFFAMNKPISFGNIASFIADFHKGNLQRRLRSSEINKKDVSEDDGSAMGIEEINSKRFSDVTQWRNSTIVVLIYSPQCALCNLMSRTLLQLLEPLKPINISFFRIDGESNDLKWEYSMETLPTLLIFPKNKTSETRVFPSNLQVSKQNLLGFILANLDRSDRLRAVTSSCMLLKTNIQFLNCTKHLRRKITDEISHELRLWQMSEETNSRRAIVQRLMAFKRIELTLLRARNSCDLASLLDDITMIVK